MEHKIVEFPAGTPVRCNRCSTRAISLRPFRAQRENRITWRQTGLSGNVECTHVDAHWVYRSDIFKIAPVVRQAHALSSGTLASLTGIKTFDELDEIQENFVQFCAENWAKYTTWQEAWAYFAEYHDTWTPRDEHICVGCGADLCAGDGDEFCAICLSEDERTSAHYEHD